MSTALPVRRFSLMPAKPGGAAWRGGVKKKSVNRLLLKKTWDVKNVRCGVCLDGALPVGNRGNFSQHEVV